MLADGVLADGVEQILCTENCERIRATRDDILNEVRAFEQHVLQVGLDEQLNGQKLKQYMEDLENTAPTSEQAENRRQNLLLYARKLIDLSADYRVKYVRRQLGATGAPLGRLIPTGDDSGLAKNGRPRRVNLVEMPSVVRPHAPAGKGHDLDFAVCQPTILEQLAHNNMLTWDDDREAPETPNIGRLVRSREKLFDELAALHQLPDDSARYPGCRKDVLKKLTTSLFFGGGYDTWIRVHDSRDVSSRKKHPVIEGIIAEVKLMRTAVSESQEWGPIWVQWRTALHKEKRGDAEAIERSIFARIAQELEHRCLMAMAVALRNRGWAILALIYDGLIVRHRVDAAIDNELLSDVRGVVKLATGFDLTVTEKPLFSAPLELRLDRPVDDEPPSDEARARRSRRLRALGSMIDTALDGQQAMPAGMAVVLRELQVFVASSIASSNTLGLRWVAAESPEALAGLTGDVAALKKKLGANNLEWDKAPVAGLTKQTVVQATDPDGVPIADRYFKPDRKADGGDVWVIRLHPQGRVAYVKLPASATYVSVWKVQSGYELRVEPRPPAPALTHAMGQLDSQLVVSLRGLTPTEAAARAPLPRLTVVSPPEPEDPTVARVLEQDDQQQEDALARYEQAELEADPTQSERCTHFATCGRLVRRDDDRKEPAVCSNCYADGGGQRADTLLDSMKRAGPFDNPKHTKGGKLKGKAQDDRRQRDLCAMLLQNQCFVPCSQTDVYTLNGGSVPDLRKTFAVADAAGDEIHLNPMGLLRARRCVLALAFGCGAGKSFRIFELLVELVNRCPNMPILFVSCRILHADDLSAELRKLGFVSYLHEKDKTAAGMQGRLRTANRAVVSIQSGRALPDDFLRKFDGRPDSPGLVVFDEIATAASYVQRVPASEEATMGLPDQSLNKLERTCAQAMVIASEADFCANGAAAAMLERLVGARRITVISADRPKLEGIVARVAFAKGGGKKADAPDAGHDDDEPDSSNSLRATTNNPTEDAFWNVLYVAVRAAKQHRTDEGFPERVYVHCATRKQTELVEEQLRERNLWDERACKRYWGGSTNKSDFQDTDRAWAGVYLVVVNTVCTVAVNIKMRFGSCFLFTSSARHGGLLRDGFQGIVRIWRLPEYYPLADGFNEGRRVINVLLDCAPPTRKAGKPLIGPADLPGLMQRQFGMKHRQLLEARAQSRQKLQHDEDRRTLAIIAHNAVERDANCSHHLALFIFHCRQTTRGFTVERIEPRDEVPPARLDDEEENEPREEDEETDERFYDIKQSDRQLMGSASRDNYRWFINDFRGWHLGSLEWRPKTFAMRFFRTLNGDFDKGFAAGGDWEDTFCTRGNGTTMRVLKGLYHTLRRIECFPAPAGPDVPITDSTGLSTGRDKQQPCHVTELERDATAVGRHAHCRLLTHVEQRHARPRTQQSVRVLDFEWLQLLQKACAVLRLAPSNIGVKLGFGWPGWEEKLVDGELVDGELVTVAPEEETLDFKPRDSHVSSGSGEGRVAHAVDLHEEYLAIGKKSESALDNEFKGDTKRRALQVSARRAGELLRTLCNITGTQVSSKASLLTMLKGVLKNLFAIVLKIGHTKGTSRSGTRTNTFVNSLTICTPLASLLPRWHVRLRDLSCDAGNNAFVAAGLARSQADSAARFAEPPSRDSGGKQDDSVAMLCDPAPPASDCTWQAPVDHECARRFVEELDARALTKKGAQVRDALATALATSENGSLQQTAEREIDAISGARVPSCGSLLTMPMDATSVLVGKTHVQLNLTSQKPGCLLFLLVRQEARELGVSTPHIDNVLSRIATMEARPNSGSWWFTSRDPMHVIVGLQREGSDGPAEAPSDALRRAAKAVHRLQRARTNDDPYEPVQEPLLTALVEEAEAVASAAMSNKKWQRVNRAMVAKYRGARGVNADRDRQRALAEAWEVVCNTLVDQVLGEVEKQLVQTGRSIACVDGRDPTWIKLLATKSALPLPNLTTKMQVRLGAKDFQDAQTDGLITAAVPQPSGGGEDTLVTLASRAGEVARGAPSVADEEVVLESVRDEYGQADRRVADPASHEDMLAVSEAREAEMMWEQKRGTGASRTVGRHREREKRCLECLEAEHGDGERSSESEEDRGSEQSSDDDDDGSLSGFIVNDEPTAKKPRLAKHVGDSDGSESESSDSDSDSCSESDEEPGSESSETDEEEQTLRRGKLRRTASHEVGGEVESDRSGVKRKRRVVCEVDEPVKPATSRRVQRRVASDSEDE